MKSLKVAKFQVIDGIPSLRIFYAIFLAIIIFIAIANVNSGGNVTSSGLELSSVIFLFIAGLNSFKTSFKFSQANNISRKTFFIGMIMGAFPIAIIMSVIDIIINRVYNIFVPCPTNFDMIYGSFRDTVMWGFNSDVIVWKQANDLFTLLGTTIWQFALYTMVFLIGILISLIYYRSNKLLKVIVSILPFMLIMLSRIIAVLLPISFWTKLGRFIENSFGWYSRNPYMAVLSFSILGIIFAGFIYLLIRKAVIKE